MEAVLNHIKRQILEWYNTVDPIIRPVRTSSLWGDSRKYISNEAVLSSATKIVPENSIAIITRVVVGKLAVMPFSYATSQDFLSLSKLKTDIVFTSYLLYKKLQSELNSVQGTSIKGAYQR